MIFIVDSEDRTQFSEDLAAMHYQRKTVFVDRSGWKLQVIAGQEIDSYDHTKDIVYLLAKDEPHGPVLASARLLPTTGFHLMQELYSATHRAALPAGSTIWEVSRFCTAPQVLSRNKRLGLLWETICGVMEITLHRKIAKVIFAANRALLPHALKCGWRAQIIVPTITDGDDEMTAVVAEVTREGLLRVRARNGVTAPAIVNRHLALDHSRAARGQYYTDT